MIDDVKISLILLFLTEIIEVVMYFYKKMISKSISLKK